MAIEQRENQKNYVTSFSNFPESYFKTNFLDWKATIRLTKLKIISNEKRNRARVEEKGPRNSET